MTARALVRTASQGQNTVRKVQDMYEFDVSVRHGQKLLHTAAHLVYTHMKRVSNLTLSHRHDRDKRARDNMCVRPVLWRRTDSSDEKRFCLGSPDGASYHWANKCVAQRFQHRHQHSGGGDMGWAGICAHGKTYILFIEYRIDDEAYIGMMKELVELSATHRTEGVGVINRTIHRHILPSTLSSTSWTLVLKL